MRHRTSRLVLSLFLLGLASSVAAQAELEVAEAAQINPVPADPPVQLQASESLTLTEPPLLESVARTPKAEPVAAKTASAPANDRLFPRYQSQKAVVAFWTRVFRDTSENQSLVHFTDYPHKVIRTLDFRGEAARLSESELKELRSKKEKRVKAEIDELLRSVHRQRYSPETMSFEERELYELFNDVRGDKKFLNAIGTVRAQRGLKERTENALQVSRSYLPEMERIFAGHGLPTQLTRLPLVESSFNVEAYSKVGAAGLWQFMPSSARIYMRLDEVVDDRRDPWTSTDAAARHLKDDYKLLGSWPLALTAYNHGRSGVAKGLRLTGGTTLPDLVARYEAKSFGFASKNFYAEFLAAKDVEKEYRAKHGAPAKKEVIAFDSAETRHYLPYDTLVRISGVDETAFRKLNPAYKPEVQSGKLYVPPGHAIRLPAGQGRRFEAAYARLGSEQIFHSQRRFYSSYKVRKGDSLGRIAKKHGITMDAIRNTNGLKKNAGLRAGQTLKIPPREKAAPKPSKPVVVVAKSEKAESAPVALETAAAVVEPSPAAETELALPDQASALAAEVVEQAAFVLHKVRRGQTLSAIAKRYRTSVSALREVNGLGESSHIRPGMKLKVPH